MAVGVDVRRRVGLAASTVGEGVGVAVGVVVEVGAGVLVGVAVAVAVGVRVGARVTVAVAVGVGMKNIATWSAPCSTWGLMRISPMTTAAPNSTPPAILKYLAGAMRPNSAGSRSAPQLGQTRYPRGVRLPHTRHRISPETWVGLGRPHAGQRVQSLFRRV